MSVEVEEIRRLKLGPDDVLIIRLPTDDGAAASYAERVIRKVLGENARVLLISKDVKLEVIEGLIQVKQ